MPIGTGAIGGGYGSRGIGTAAVVSSDSAIGTDQSGIILLRNFETGTAVDDGDWAIPIFDNEVGVGIDVGSFGILRIDFDLGHATDSVKTVGPRSFDNASGVDEVLALDTGSGLVLLTDSDHGVGIEAGIGTPPNPIINGGFEFGLVGWTIDSSFPAPTTSTTEVFTGTSSLLLGTPGTFGTEPLGDSALYQTFTVPLGDTALVMDIWQQTTDSIRFDWQEAQIRDTGGTMLAQIFKECENFQSWVRKSFDMTPYAGMTVQLYLNVHEDDATDLTSMYVDDIHFETNAAPLISATLTSPDTAHAIDGGEGRALSLGSATSSITVSVTGTLSAKTILHSGPIGTDLSTSSWWRFAVSGTLTVPTPPDTPPDPLVKTATVRVIGNVGDTILDVQPLTGGIAFGTVLYLGPDAVVTVVDYAPMGNNTLTVLPLTTVLNVGIVLLGTPTYPSPPPPPPGGYTGPPPPPPSTPPSRSVRLKRTSIIMPTPVLDSQGRPS